MFFTSEKILFSEVRKMDVEKRFVTTSQLAKILKKNARSLENERQKGLGIPYIKLKRKVLYDLVDVAKYLKSHRIEPAKK